MCCEMRHQITSYTYPCCDPHACLDDSVLARSPRWGSKQRQSRYNVYRSSSSFSISKVSHLFVLWLIHISKFYPHPSFSSSTLPLATQLQGGIGWNLPLWNGPSLQDSHRSTAMAFSGPIPILIIRNQADWKPIFGNRYYTFAVKMKRFVSQFQTTTDEINQSTILRYFIRVFSIFCSSPLHSDYLIVYRLL